MECEVFVVQQNRITWLKIFKNLIIKWFCQIIINSTNQILLLNQSYFLLKY